jgi:hypothetical protein
MIARTVQVNRTARMGHAEQNRQTQAARIGLPRKDSQEKTTRQDCYVEQDCQNRAPRTEMPAQGCQHWAASIGLPAQDCLDKTARAGQKGEDSQEMTAKEHPEQNS